ncbi:MbnP family protein [Fulvivirga sediminis]|uniref:Copper-binding protein MbnP-like domain-containing protein n=1 Tax=Fulvivirga sediminis TaxID=2803949 RepID=A0A937F8N5_9BACT|nr:MbnP family protein [Fulvivirga sediminis]MBL3656013.1 hypothetical protein [Fulvivirga sediminis]
MKSFKLLYISVLSLFLFISCGDDDEAQLEGGQAILEFDNRVGMSNLQLNTSDYPYTNSQGQAFNVSMLKYYVSNIKFSREDGTEYTFPLSEDGSEGYYLVNEQDKSTTLLDLNGIPEGKYTGVTFTVGVDADRILEGAQTGALDVTNDMFWSWNAGYIFMKFEGHSPVSTEDGAVLEYHVGGYKADPKQPNLADNVKQISLNGEFSINENKKPQIHIIVDVLQFFDSPNEIDFSSNASRHTPAASIDVAENYVNAFILDHIHE